MKQGAEQYAKKNQEAVKEAKEKLTAGVAAFFQSDQYKKYLDFCSKMPSYSWRNTVLVYLQKPDASMVMTAKQWNERFERMVNKGERSTITLLRPNIAKFDDVDKFHIWLAKHPYFVLPQTAEETLTKTGKLEFATGFSAFKVFDISQTNGKELDKPIIVTLLEGDVEGFSKVKEALISIAKENGVDVAFLSKDELLNRKPDCRGYFSSYNDRIVVRDGMSEKQTISTLVHELAHSLLHGKEMKVEGIKDTSVSFQNIKELQAESVSYVVCQKFGIETEQKTFGYIGTWIDTGNLDKNIKKMEDNLDVITKCSMKIIGALEKQLEKRKDFCIEQEEAEAEVER